GPRGPGPTESRCYPPQPGPTAETANLSPVVASGYSNTAYPAPPAAPRAPSRSTLRTIRPRLAASTAAPKPIAPSPEQRVPRSSARSPSAVARAKSAAARSQGSQPPNGSPAPGPMP